MISDALANYLHVPPRGYSSGPLTVSLAAQNGLYVVAENGGGDVVNATRSAIGPWETFGLVDLNGGALNDGDPVAFRTDNGAYFQALYGGGDTLRSAFANVGSWETFTIVDLDRPGGTVQSWDAIALRTANGYYVVAENGGGDVVNANRTAVGPWETFHLVIH